MKGGEGAKGGRVGGGNEGKCKGGGHGGSGHFVVISLTHLHTLNSNSN